MGFDRRRHSARLAVGAAALMATGAFAAQASAAQLALNQGCYYNTTRSTAKVGVVGTGFPPGGTVDIGGGVFGTTTASATGSFVIAVRAPNATIKPGARKFSVTATGTDPNTFQQTSAATSAYYTLAGVAFSDNFVGFGKRITYYFGGFRSGKQIYGHYFVGKRQTGRKRFGKATGPCGTLKAKATGYPVSRAHPNKWTVFYDNVKKFKKRAIPTYIEKFHKV